MIRWLLRRYRARRLIREARQRQRDEPAEDEASRRKREAAEHLRWMEKARRS